MPWDCHCNITTGHSFDCGYNTKPYLTKAAQMNPNDQTNTLGYQGDPNALPVAPLKSAISRLNKDLVECHNLVSQLTTVLEPVLGYEKSEPSDTATKATAEGNSWLDVQLAELNLDIADLQARLQALIDRVYL